MVQARRIDVRFGLRSAGVWVVMVVVLVVVPDTLERWMPLNVARVCGWVLASGIWVAVLERDWQDRFGPPPGSPCRSPPGSAPPSWPSGSAISFGCSDGVGTGTGNPARG